MRKKIQDLAYARFREEKPEVRISTDRLELTVIQGEDAAGSFFIHSDNPYPLRGFVFSSHSRMECLKTKFEGMHVEIPYVFHTEGLSEGSVIQGEFSIVCDGGEYSLSFYVSVTRCLYHFFYRENSKTGSIC